MVPANVGVFFGKIDQRPQGWYWVDARSEKLRGTFQGPFESKQLAVEDALRLRDAANETGERGVA
jgi:hypothetical protein